MMIEKYLPQLEILTPLRKLPSQTVGKQYHAAPCDCQRHLLPTEILRGHALLNLIRNFKHTMDTKITKETVALFFDKLAYFLIYSFPGVAVLEIFFKKGYCNYVNYLL